MRSITTATTAFLLLVLTGPAFGQIWNVELVDVRNEDPDLDRTRAEAVEFLADGKTLVTAGAFYLAIERRSYGEVRLRSLKDGSLTATLIGKAKSYCVRASSLACSPDGKRIAAAGWTEKREWIVDVFDAMTLKHTHTLKGESSFPTGLEFSPTKNVLAVVPQ